MSEQLQVQLFLVSSAGEFIPCWPRFCTHTHCCVCTTCIQLMELWPSVHVDLPAAYGATTCKIWQAADSCVVAWHSSLVLLQQPSSSEVNWWICNGLFQYCTIIPVLDYMVHRMQASYHCNSTASLHSKDLLRIELSSRQRQASVQELNSSSEAGKSDP